MNKLIPEDDFFPTMLILFGALLAVMMFLTGLYREHAEQNLVLACVAKNCSVEHREHSVDCLCKESK